MTFKVNLTYFKRSGKYYSEGYFVTNREGLLDIWFEVEGLAVNNRLPSLAHGIGPSEFIVSIDIPDHPNNIPRLII